MVSPIIRASLQAAVMAAVSNTLAQLLQEWRTGSPYHLNLSPIFNFVVFALLNTPPNFLWQQYLEETFPGFTVAPEIVDTKDSDKVANGGSGAASATKEIVPKKRLNKTNTAIKFSLDQTLGALFNTVVFLGGMSALKGADQASIIKLIRRDTLPLMMAGYKLWPMVSLLSFTVIPVQHRLLFGGFVGMGWGIFLSLFASH